MKESERNISECILAFKKSRDMIKRRKMKERTEEIPKKNLRERG